MMCSLQKTLTSPAGGSYGRKLFLMMTETVPDVRLNCLFMKLEAYEAYNRKTIKNKAATAGLFRFIERMAGKRDYASDKY